MRSRVVALLLGVAFATPARVQAAVRVVRPATRAVPASAMARIPAGTYRPLYAATGTPRVRVAPFFIDREPVTRGDYLRFVEQNPRWRRGAVRPLFAETRYLADWPSDASAGDAEDLRRPVTSVSWFAARAYCAAQDKRLPTVDEWELVAAASATRRDASGDVSFRHLLLALYAARKPAAPAPIGTTFVNAYGVRDLHGLALATGGNRPLGWEAEVLAPVRVSSAATIDVGYALFRSARGAQAVGLGTDGA